MSVVATRRTPGVGARRTGYAIAVAINAVLLYLVNVRPGWDVLTFLTADMNRVIGLVNASLVVSLVANVVYLVHDPRWLKALGDAVTTTVGLFAMVRMYRVFPFDFGDTSVDWDVIVRVLLWVGIIGSAIGIVVAFVSFGRALAGRR